jgi:energy-converting hydrogenase Eha subunit E
MNKPEWILIAIGCIAAALNGSREPLHGIIQAELAIVIVSKIFIFEIYIFYL